MTIMLPDVLFFFFFSSKIFSTAFLAERILLLGVMVLLWIQVQNKMEDEALLLSNQSRERFHMWRKKKNVTGKLTIQNDPSFYVIIICAFCVFLTFAKCLHRAEQGTAARVKG